MADLCQQDYEAVRPDRYFPTTLRTGECAACEETTFVARVGGNEVREAKYARFMALPLTPENPDKVRGPAVGARVVYVGSSERLRGVTGTVTERSYIWSPDKRNGDTRGFRRYDDSVVQFDNGSHVVVLDTDLQED